MRISFFLLFALLGIFTLGSSQQKYPEPAKTRRTGDSLGPVRDIAPVITHSSVIIGGKSIHYTAATGFMVMRNEKGKALSRIFYIAYTRDGITDKSSRPMTFCYNGGPGSSSVWLHMGMIGPRRVILGDSGRAPAPPYQYVNNQYCWLDNTDLVFIDPVTTGYSQPAPGENANQFHGYSEDIRSVGDFIRSYIAKQERWGSPKFLAGESYGTMRSAGLSTYLQDQYGMYLNGIILVSTIMNWETIGFSRANDLPYILYLPTYAAAAWYHHKVDPSLQGSLQQTVDEARKFAGGTYATALMEGDQISSSDRDKVAAELHRLTGIPLTYILGANLRITIGRFCKELLRDEGKTIGRYDSRVTNTDYDNVGESPDFDPSYASVLGAFSGAINDYLEKDLDFKDRNPYNILTGVGPWPYHSDNRYFDNSQSLRLAMTENPYLRVWVLCGYFDLATPFYSVEYTIHHMGLKPYQQSHIHLTYYESGHMIYVNHASLVQAKKDEEAFYGMAVPK